MRPFISHEEKKVYIWYLVLPEKILLGWKGLQEQTLNLNCLFVIYKIKKSFIKLTPGANVIKLFCLRFTNFRSKLECLSLVCFSSLV